MIFFVLFCNFSYASYALFFVNCIFIFDDNHHDVVTNDNIFSMLLTLISVFFYNLDVNFFNKLIILFFFVDLSLIMSSYVELIVILMIATCAV